MPARSQAIQEREDNVRTELRNFAADNELDSFKSDLIQQQQEQDAEILRHALTDAEEIVRNLKEQILASTTQIEMLVQAIESGTSEQFDESVIIQALDAAKIDIENFCVAAGRDAES
eukprot:Clim_evm49s88 gene=Clim_evmTU49s88